MYGTTRIGEVLLENKKEKQKFEKADCNIRPYLAIGLIAVLVIVISIIVFFSILRYSVVKEYLDKIVYVLQPITIGLVFAYLINPIVKWQEKYLVKFYGKYIKTPKKAKKTARITGIITSIVLVLSIVGLLLYLVIPELYSSIERVVVQLPEQADGVIAWIESYTSSDDVFAAYLESAVDKGFGWLETWIETQILPRIKELLTSVTSGVISFLKLLLNILVGIVVSVYVLMSKELFMAQAKKMVYVVLPIEKGNVLIDIVRKSHEIFGGFISGKIVDSAIIGVLCFLGVSFLKMPYTLLISVIVGVTNVVPFFGPFIGAIPCSILILLIDPLKGLYFIIFVFLLQQLDGNVIGPKILGDSTGLSSFWVIFSIIVAGGLFGFAGMVVGVPAFATLLYLLRRISAFILKRKGLPIESDNYRNLDLIVAETKKMTYKENEE